MSWTTSLFKLRTTVLSTGCFKLGKRTVRASSSWVPGNRRRGPSLVLPAWATGRRSGTSLRIPHRHEVERVAKAASSSWRNALKTLTTWAHSGSVGCGGLFRLTGVLHSSGERWSLRREWPKKNDGEHEWSSQFGLRPNLCHQSSRRGVTCVSDSKYGIKEIACRNSDCIRVHDTAADDPSYFEAFEFVIEN